MGKSMEESKLAVDCGYWPLYRFNPELAKQGKQPLILDSKAPDGNLRTFLAGENRYAQLEKNDPETANKLHEELNKEYNDRYRLLKQLSELTVTASEDPLLQR